jgi:GTPase SAR1 family protein
MDSGVHKVVVLGVGGVGKSALTIRLVTGKYIFSFFSFFIFFFFSYKNNFLYFIFYIIYIHILLLLDHFLEEYNPTIEDNFQKNATIDGIPTVIDILDTAGQEEYISMQDQWVREGNGFLLVYAVNEMASFEVINRYREKILRTKGKDSKVAMYVNYINE